MSEYIENMFAIPIFHLYADDWENKKEKLKGIASRANYDQKPGEYCYSDYYDLTKQYWEEIAPLITPEIQRFVDRTQFNLIVDKYWFETSERDECHLIHNHGPLGYSAVMYIEYDEEEHEPAYFMAPYNDFHTGLQQSYRPHDIKSGSVIFFPSTIHHFTPPSKSDKKRLILSWNLTEASVYLQSAMDLKSKVEDKPKSSPIKINYV